MSDKQRLTNLFYNLQCILTEISVAVTIINEAFPAEVNIDIDSPKLLSNDALDLKNSNSKEKQLLFSALMRQAANTIVLGTCKINELISNKEYSDLLEEYAKVSYQLIKSFRDAFFEISNHKNPIKKYRNQYVAHPFIWNEGVPSYNDLITLFRSAFDNILMGSSTLSKNGFPGFFIIIGGLHKELTDRGIQIDLLHNE